MKDLLTDVEQLCIQVRQTSGMMARQGKGDTKRVALEREGRGEPPLTETGRRTCLDGCWQGLQPAQPPVSPVLSCFLCALQARRSSLLCIKTCWFCTLPDCVSFGISKLFNSLPVQLGSLQQPLASIKLWLWFHSTECSAAMAAPGTLVRPAAQFLPWWLPPHHTQGTPHAIKTSPNCSKTAVSYNQSLTSSLHCVPSFPNLLLFFQTSVIFTTMLWCECETFLQYLASFLKVICQAICGNTAVMAVSSLAD